MRKLAIIAILLAIAAAALMGWIAWQTLADGGGDRAANAADGRQAGLLVPSPDDRSGSADEYAMEGAEGKEDALDEKDAENVQGKAPLEYATAWLITPIEGVDAGVPVKLLYLPDLDVPAHRNGWEIAADEQLALQDSWPVPCADEAVIASGDEIVAVDPDLLLVNLPDVLPQAAYDVVYSYAATSNCGGENLPGVTGQHVDGYAYGMQPSAYWASDRFAVPCAYRTALKARAASDALNEAGWRLLVYDAYRPMTAQYQLASALTEAFAENPAVQEALGGWSVDWFVAPGASGHNFGADIDAGVCDWEGNPAALPSAFDSFDATGRLTDYPVEDSAIDPSSYRWTVYESDACMALHEAFRAAGFTELASEWWHFGDLETEAAIRAVVGSAGLDFVAYVD